MAEKYTEETYNIIRVLKDAETLPPKEGETVTELAEVYVQKSFPPSAPVGARIDELSKDGNTYYYELVSTSQKDI